VTYWLKITNISYLLFTTTGRGDPF